MKNEEAYRRPTVFWGWAAVAGLSLFLHKDGFQRRTYLNFDEAPIIDPVCNGLRDNQSLSLALHNSVDVQPLRDLTYLFDCSLSELTSFPTFTYTNWILFFLSLYLAGRWIQKRTGHLGALSFALILATHPLLVPLIEWWAARKHVLALVFLLASLQYLKRWQQSLIKDDWVKALYPFGLWITMITAACFSHPAAVGWLLVPFAMFVTTRSSSFTDSLTSKKHLTFASTSFLSAGLGLVIIIKNFSYYSSPAFTETVFGSVQDKIMSVDSITLLERVNLLGNAFFQALFGLFPEVTPIASHRSPHGLIGLSGYILVAYFSRKIMERSDWWTMQALTITNLIPTLLISNPTPIADTYLGPACIGSWLQIIFIAKHLIPKYSARFGWLLVVALVVTVGVFYSISEKRVAIWQDSKTLWSQNLKEKRSLGSIRRYTRQLIRDQSVGDELSALLETLAIGNPDHPQLGFLIYLGSDKATLKDLNRSVLMQVQSPWVYLLKFESTEDPLLRRIACIEVGKLDLGPCSPYEPQVEKALGKLALYCSDYILDQKEWDLFTRLSFGKGPWIRPSKVEFPPASTLERLSVVGAGRICSYAP